MHYVNNDSMLMQKDVTPPIVFKPVPQIATPGSNLNVWRAEDDEKKGRLIDIIVIGSLCVVGAFMGYAVMDMLHFGPERRRRRKR